jgi:hypothetical protein
MKKVFLTLAVVFATSTVLVSCGGKKEGASENASEAATTQEVKAEDDSMKSSDEGSQNEGSKNETSTSKDKPADKSTGK